MVPSWADQLLQQLLMEQFDTSPIQYRLNKHMHEGVWLNFLFEKMTAMKTIIPLYGFCICMDSAFIGRSTPTTAFDGAIRYFADTM